MERRPLLNPSITGAIEALVLALRESAPEEMVSFTLFVNSEERTITTSERSPEDLKRAGISMQNLRGEFIRPKPKADRK